MSEADRELLEDVATYCADHPDRVLRAISVLARQALKPQINTEETPPYFHLGAEADGFLTIHPKL